MTKQPQKVPRDPRQDGLGDGGVAITELLAKEGERGCVLAGAEFLSDALAHRLIEVFAKNIGEKEAKAMLFGKSRYETMLTSFSARIELARALGLIDENTRTALNAVRFIRNDCAHSPGLIDLEDAIYRPNVLFLEDFFRKLIANAKWDGPSPPGDLKVVGEVEGYEVDGADGFGWNRMVFVKAVAFLHYFIYVTHSQPRD